MQYKIVQVRMCKAWASAEVHVAHLRKAALRFGDKEGVATVNGAHVHNHVMTLALHGWVTFHAASVSWE